ncbi:oligosaccharide repeat unit polymerase [Pseudoalteromonas piratica]|uniref:Membrane protein n=1 Tax=Pseudoalteromonas piratica TaxID=1348114 RepID=A0A0A7EL42_9GAMM|nr:oligosaccharide repeat unit polymerase [Pseudoalteromonas piratica]AIY66652.1 membrane protein [Pseudoalteromonas piratica]
MHTLSQQHNASTSPFKLAIMGLLVSITVIALFQIAGPAAPFALLLLPFALFFTIRYSVIFVILFILFSYFRIHEAFPVLMPLKIPKLLALASLFGIVWHLVLSKKLSPFWHPAHTVFISFFLWLTICVLMATNRGMAIEYWSSTLSKVLIMVFVISWWVNSPRAFGIARFGIMFSGALIAFVAVSNKLNGIGLVEGTRVTISRHLQSQIGDPNDLSLVLLFPVSFLCAELFNKESTKLYRIGAFLVLCLVVYGIIATQSRGGLLGVMAIVAYFLARTIKNPVVLLSILAVGLGVLLVAAGISDRQSGGAAESGIDESAMGRIYAWQAAINMALSNPLTGVGVNNFYVNYFFYSPHWDGKNHAVHSTWFQVLGETGFVGISLFATLIATIYRTLKRSGSLVKYCTEPNLLVNVQALKAGLIGFVVSGTFLTQAFTWPIYIVLSLSIALEQMLQMISKSNAEVTHDS